jgi:hypothetical protein
MSNPSSDDNDRRLNFIAETIELIRDQMATKTDLAALEEKMATKDGVAVIRGDIEQVQLRLDTIERTLSTRLDQVDTEISRLRSVLYLLVKDRPDLLRLLGQVPS